MARTYVMFRMEMSRELYGGELHKGWQMFPNTTTAVGITRMVEAGNTVHVLTVGEDGVLVDDVRRPPEEEEVSG